MYDSIISVEISNRIISNNTEEPTKEDELDIFPFERIYLTKNPNIIPRIFKYYLSMPLTHILLKALNNIKIHKIQNIPINRNDTHTITNTNKIKTHAFNFIQDIENWTLIVPTKITTIIENGYVIQLLDYVMVKRGISPFYNKKPKLPQIKLHIRNKATSMLCGRCTNITQMYDGDCSPGTASCASNHKIIIGKKKLKKNKKDDKKSDV